MNNIRWGNNSGPEHHYGFIGDDLASGNKYYVCPHKGAAIADVRGPLGEWLDLNIPFDTVEEAKQWCEVVEATGAY